MCARTTIRSQQPHELIQRAVNLVLSQIRTKVTNVQLFLVGEFLEDPLPVAKVPDHQHADLALQGLLLFITGERYQTPLGRGVADPGEIVVVTGALLRAAEVRLDNEITPGL